MQEITIHRTEILSDKNYPLKEVHFTRKEGDGSEQEQTRELYFHGNAAATLLYHPERKTVILTRQFRLPVYLSDGGEGLLLEACAGLIDEGESPEESMRRELMEETGFEISQLERQCAAYSSPGFSTEKLFLYLARYTPAQKVEEGGGLEEEGEKLEVVEMTYAEAFRLLEAGSIADLKTITLLQCLRLRGEGV
jgi:GDP-mannose pyrophosphatase NudK